MGQPERVLTEAEASRRLADWMVQKPTDTFGRDTGEAYLTRRVEAKVRELADQIASEVVEQHPHLAGYLRQRVSELVAAMLDKESNGVIQDALVTAVARAFREQISKRTDSDEEED